MYRSSLIGILASLFFITTYASAQSLGSATEVSSAGVFLPEDEGLVVSNDGSWMLALTLNGGAIDLVSTILDDRGLPVSTEDFGLPGSLGASVGNPGLAMAKSGRFAVFYGNNGANDLVLVRRGPNDLLESLTLDLPGGLTPALDSVPVIPDDERYVVALGPGGAFDLFVVPIVNDASGRPAFGSALPVSFSANGNYPFLNGIRPVVTRDGNAIVIPGVGTTQDLHVVRVPTPADASPLLVTAVSYPSNNFVADPSVPVAVSPDGTWVATAGSPTLGDIVVTPLGPTGAPGVAENVLLSANNNIADTSRPLLVSPDGRVIGVEGTLINGDLALVPVDDTGDAGAALNVGFAVNNFIPSGSPPSFMAPNGRYIGSVGSATIGDLVVTEIGYLAATNSVSATARNVPFPNNANRRNGAAFDVSEDGAVIATYGADTNAADLIVVTVDPFGVSGSVFTIPFPSFNNVNPDSVRPVVDPGATWVAAPGSPTTGDLVLLNLVRNSNCVLIPGSIETRTLAFNNNFDLDPVDLRVAPTRQFIYGLGTDPLGDVGLVPFDDARVYPLAPACMGQALELRFSSPADPFAFYQAGASFARCPGIAADASRRIDLANDLLLQLSLTSDPAFFGFAGQLGPNGNGFGALFLPVVPEARGLPLHLAFVVLDPMDPSGIGTISRSTSIVLR